MHIPEIQNSPAPASAPANRAAANSGMHASVQPAPKFKNVFGSMMSEEEHSSQPASSGKAKASSPQDPSLVQTSNAAPQPIILPSGLQINLLPHLEAPPDSSPNPDAPEQTVDPSLPVPAIPISNPLTARTSGISTASPTAAKSPAAANPLLSAHIQTADSQLALAHLPLSQFVEEAQASDGQPSTPNQKDAGSAVVVEAPQQLTVNADGANTPSNATLAFSAKLTSIPGVQQAGNAAGSRTGATQPTTANLTAEQIAQQDTPAVNALSGGQQADTDAGNGSLLSSKQFQKLATKYQADQETQQSDSVTPTATQIPPQDQGISIQQRPVSVAPEPAASVTAATPATVPASKASDARPAAAALPETNIAAKSEPVKDLSLKLGTGPANQVEVKIQDRAGEVHVSVLSSSPTLTTDLRQQVGDLVGKLDRAGYHAETFRPSGSNASQQNSTQSDSNEQQNLGGRQQQQQDDSRQQSSARQRRTNQPQWLQEMNKNLGLSAVEGSQS